MKNQQQLINFCVSYIGIDENLITSFLNDPNSEDLSFEDKIGEHIFMSGKIVKVNEQVTISIDNEPVVNFQKRINHFLNNLYE